MQETRTKVVRTVYLDHYDDDDCLPETVQYRLRTALSSSVSVTLRPRAASKTMPFEAVLRIVVTMDSTDQHDYASTIEEIDAALAPLNVEAPQLRIVWPENRKPTLPAESAEEAGVAEVGNPPGVQRAVSKFVDGVRKAGAEVTISTPTKSVTVK